MFGRGEELVDHRAVLLDREVSERPGNRAHQQPQIVVVTLIVLDHRLAEPGEVVFVRRLERLLLAQRRIGLGHRRETP